MVRPASNIARVLVCAGFLVAGGCYHYRVAPAGSPVADDGHRAVRHSLAWGLAQAGTARPDCQGNGVAEVTASTNLAFLLVGVVTLGIYVPMTLEWKCAKDRVRPENGLD